MKFSDSFLDEIRARLPVSQVVSRRVSLKRAGREWKGLSPFNKEKTPSFTVNDQKGFYHCFSSGKHGDQFSFLMETEGLSFPEAVEKLALEAGLSLPKPDPQFERSAKERLGLFDALEAACALFEESLASPEGREALTYAERRGLSRATLKEFRIGFAPSAKDTLKAALLKKGLSESQLLEAGLIVKPEDGRPAYDRFRNRLTIPILDAKSRVIAFGARALDPAGEPKYLNSPETKLFDKGSTIFSLARARKAAFEQGELIVVEGYMDVIALNQAGFSHAVATLGTAFTERQMEILWQLAPEPIICFDGDKAGEAAAARAIDRMLPNLREGRSFRFAFLPEGSDPDDLVRNEGRAGFERVLAAARPLIDVLWLRELRAAPLDTPERRAAFEARLEALTGEIANNRVREQYRREIKDRMFQLWRGTRQKPVASGSRPLSGSERRASLPLPVEQHRAAVTILVALLNHPWLLDRFAEEVAATEIRHRRLAALLAFVTQSILEEPGIGREGILTRLRTSEHHDYLERVLLTSPAAREGFVQPDMPPAEVEQHFADFLFRFRALPRLEKELKESADRLAETAEEAYERFSLLQQQVSHALERHSNDDELERKSLRRLEETRARLKAERISARRGRRPEKYE